MFDVEKSTPPEQAGLQYVKKTNKETLDPGIAFTPAELDLGRQITNLVHHKHLEKGDVECSVDSETTQNHGSGIIYVDFAEGDERNPANYSLRSKWVITITACTLTLLNSVAASSYNLGFSSMTRDLNCTEFQATIGLSLYALGFGVVPLVSAPLSEDLGRQPLYIGSIIGFLLMHIMVALSKNIQSVLIARFLGGAFGSTGATMVGGTIADIWQSQDRGLPMSIFSFTALGALGLGPVAAGWVEQDPRLEWRWIQWIHAILMGVFLIVAPFCLKETRATVLLTRMAKKLRKTTGDHRYRARVEDERESMLLLLTEPIVLSFSLWIGFAWGIFYGMIESIAPVFKNLHGWDDGQVGTVFITATIGTVLGFLTNMYQETLYRKHFPKRGPEARLYTACFAAVLFPVGMFIYAWSSFPHITWVALAIGIIVFIWAVYIIYLAVFTYLADCYGPFASSALAGQSLCRNIMAMAFPLFTQQMFAKMTYKWANTMFALIAIIMIPIPYVLFFYGPWIRSRGRFSKLVPHNRA